MPNIAVIARTWNAEDLVHDWLDAVTDWAQHLFVLDGGSSDGTWEVLQHGMDVFRVSGVQEAYRLPPSAPMLSGFYTGMLLRMLDYLQPELVVHLDHDEFLEPEIVDWFPQMLADAEHDAWSIVRRNFAFGRTHYEGTSSVLRFREHFCYRWFPGLRHPSPIPNGRPRQQGIHHLERIPLGHPAREDASPAQVNGVSNYVPQLNARFGALPDVGPWMLHYSFRDERRNRLQYDRLKVGASEDCPNFLASREALNCPLIEYVPFEQRVSAEALEGLAIT